MNFDLFLIQNVFQEFDFSQNYFYLAQLDVENPSLTRNPNPKRIQDNNESPSTTRIQDVARNPNAIRIQDVIRNPYPTRIEDAVRNPYPIRIEDPLTYNESTITWACAKKMKEAIHMLIPTIWA